MVCVPLTNYSLTHPSDVDSSVDIMSSLMFLFLHTHLSVCA